jgi:hypothetical protein
MRLIALGLRWLFCGRSELIGSALAGFKSRFRTTGEAVIADGGPDRTGR